MKKKLCTLLAILSIFIVYSDNVQIENKKLIIKEIIEKKTKVYSSSLSIGVFSGLNLGYGKIVSNKKFTKERIWIIHAAKILPKYLMEHYFLAGIYYQTNYFKNPERVGFFFKTDIGVDCFYTESSSNWFSGVEEGSKIWIFPNIAFGIGNSFQINKNNSFRISIDVGIKVLICNLNLTFLF